ncbi:MAG: hypothetical protein MI974_26670, partial [Chitinophagales bacterium]|nr:hypothetical protein [Chitinophagales bacterium]
MKELQDYKELISKGSDHYLSILKENDLYDEVLQRINRKNKSEPISLIRRIFKDQSNFSEYLFSDLTYSLSYFYEGFEFNLKQVIDLSLQGLKYDYQIITQFHDRQTKAIKSSTTLYSNGKQDEIDAELFASLVNSSDMQWKVVFNQEDEHLEFNWVNYDEENLINFLNFINNICERNNSKLKWLPIASSYGSNFIFTTQKRYDSIIELHLMPPEGFEMDEVAIVHYPRGISAAKKPNEEILPISNISCEVPMEKKEK